MVLQQKPRGTGGADESSSGSSRLEETWRTFNSVLKSLALVTPSKLGSITPCYKYCRPSPAVRQINRQMDMQTDIPGGKCNCRQKEMQTQR
jgi:hypothetical protein